ncbi:alpha-amylase family glycosyl hydrolase [Chondrinema litorale]|uniref:alpha-amylase family glycosyl hydrolase n=1 Tax=Chondrinema litorale TaxID=2994555 RepID=UPI0025436705|nr:alpha-amylase family glycosyl hydrolase [Chondrinema litorale]UZR93789.1 alpha-amylase family glycosyl hydrolase [Chondrinema litorale]
MKNLTAIIPILFIILFMADCQKKDESKLSQELILDENPQGDKIIIYQMMTRLFGNKNSTNKPWGTIEENGVGKFKDINDKALTELKELGITHVWYTGAIEHAVIRDYTEYGISLDDADVVKGRAGSPYAIKDYYDVNPDLADNVQNRMQEFEALIERTHQQGLKVIIDFVPNHVARNYISDAKPEDVKDLGEDDDTSKAFDPNNNFYYITNQAFKVPEDYQALGDNTFPTKDGMFEENPAKATGNDVFSANPSINDWFETVKLNYGVDYQNDRATHFDTVPDTWLKMTDILKYWAGKGVDAFRCDMAEMVPVEFWNYAVTEVKKVNPEIIFIAEIYNPDAYRNYIDTGKFDFLYDKVQLYDTLKNIIQDKGSTANLTEIWQNLNGINKHMLRFLENHDEQRIASPDFAGEAENAIPAMLLSATMYSGPVMIYFGQEVGETGADAEGFGGEDGRTTIFDYWGVPAHQKWMNDGAFDGALLDEKQKGLRKFYKDLLNFTKSSSAIANGKFIDLQPLIKEDESGVSNKCYVYLRNSTEESLLIISNFSSDNNHQISLSIPSDLSAILDGSSFKLQQVLGDPHELNNKSFKTGNDLEFDLPPLEALIFKLTKDE